jgi:xanthine dehydrogenase accessory factor
MDILEKSYQLKKENIPFVIATIIEAEGSTPGKTGFKMITTESGETFGSVGGGTVEKLVERDAQLFLKRRMNKTKEYNFHPDKPSSGKETGMICGGNIKVYFEIHVPKQKVYIFGGGHVSQALERILSIEKYSIVIIDNRKEFSAKSMHPIADELVCEEYEIYLKTMKPVSGSCAVIVTHGHRFDYNVLKIIIERHLPFKYIGMIGSKTKVQATLNKIKKELGDVNLENLYSPIGIDLGGSSASEIALSIAAEMQAVEYSRKVPHMRIV